jgi:serine/threonine-protein phosphatase with EF-hand domain
MGCGSSVVVTPDTQSNQSERLKAAVLIQRWYRRRLTWMEAKRQCHWAIFQKIEYAGEQDQHKLHEFFTTCLEVFPHAKSG